MSGKAAEVRLALLEADVAVRVVDEFVEMRQPRRSESDSPFRQSRRSSSSR